MNETHVAKPAPHPSALSQPYWDGTAHGKLLIQHCAACGKPRAYPRYICDACLSFDAVWKESSGRGTVHSWTVAHHPFHPAFKEDLPYTLVAVDLLEGVRALGRSADRNGAGLRLGLPVRVTFDPGPDGTFALPRFVPEAP